MQVQYVYDENGKKTSVIVPIALWENVSPRKNSANKTSVFDPSKFRGIYRNRAINFDKELKCLRQEWERV